MQNPHAIPVSVPTSDPDRGQRNAPRIWLLRSTSAIMVTIIAAAICIGANRAEPTAARAQVQPLQPLSSTTARTVSTEGDWPALSVDYRTPHGRGHLEYTNAHDWTARSPGSVMTFSGTTLSHDAANTVFANGEPAIVHEDLHDGIAVPERWLHPRFAATLLFRNYAVTPGSTPQTLQFQMRWTAPCPPQSPPGTPDTPRPASCETPATAATGTDTYTELETYIFRTDITPPLAILGTSEIDGVTTVLFEVLSVNVHTTP